MLLHCQYCNYKSDRQYNLDRHYNNKHSEKINENHTQTNETNTFYCKKCYKEYASNRYLIDHEQKCDGIDTLTCKICMTRFAHKQSKYNHTKQ
jgi:hypothetical protein